ncbi:hypothetical protein CVT26_007526 [Gymnopilus dilepis]|uniref:CCHC-type domain-containing protein n=1 Tax=Gymnopilus dilepis TaxID=231916 RepID=A0A409WHZ2_9AGAR|nr:hypothetical protein CVT26_007526 [Gymnopilus dilepis]
MRLLVPCGYLTYGRYSPRVSIRSDNSIPERFERRTAARPLWVVDASSLTDITESPLSSSLVDISDPAKTKSDLSEETYKHPPEPIRLEAPSIFHGLIVMDNWRVPNETLRSSVEHFVGLYDPDTDYDPLVEYGVDKGVLPNRSLEETAILRDVLLRWTRPHAECLWADLSLHIENPATFKVSAEDVISYMNYDGITLYSILPERLYGIGHMVLALTQILHEMAEHSWLSSSAAFTVDPHYRLVRSLASQPTKERVLLAAPVLRERCINAVNHVRKYLNKLKSMFLNRAEAFSVSSYDSSTPTERIALLDRSPSTLLVSLVARDNMADKLDEELLPIRAKLLDEERAKGRTYPPAPYSHRSRSDGVLAPQGLLDQRAQYQDLINQRPFAANLESASAYLEERKRKKNKQPIPESISSMPKFHPVSAMPGVGQFPPVPEFPVGLSGGPSVPLENFTPNSAFARDAPPHLVPERLLPTYTTLAPPSARPMLRSNSAREQPTYDLRGPGMIRSKSYDYQTRGLGRDEFDPGRGPSDHRRNEDERVSLRNQSTAKPYRRPFIRKRTANRAETRDEDLDQEDSEKDKSSGEEDQPEKEAHVAGPSRFRRNSFAPKAGKFPRGGTINGYQFVRDDSVVSDPKPNGECYLCTSKNHFFRDCPHFNKFQLFRSAHVITLNEDVLSQADRDYVDSFSQSKSSSSYIPESNLSELNSNMSMSEASETSCSEDSLINKEVFVIDARSTGAFSAHAQRHVAPNRNQRRRVHFEKKGKAVESPSEPRITRKARRVRRSQKLKLDPSNSNQAEARPFVEERSRDETSEVTGSLDCSKPGKPRIIVVRKGRALPDGFASLGARALHIKAQVSSLNQEPIKVRLDTGADITLMSEDFKRLA